MNSPWTVPGLCTGPPSWPASGWCHPVAPGCSACVASGAQTSPAPSLKPPRGAGGATGLRFGGGGLVNIPVLLT